MPNVLAMSFEGELAPSFDLHCLRPDRRAPDGWGIGFYPGGDASAMVLKEPAPPHESIRSELVKSWEHLESSLFLLHVRSATWGANTTANTQPFERAWGGRDWLMAHSGSLRHRLDAPPSGPFEPVGSTDSERIFCELLNRAAEAGARSLGALEPAVLRQWFADFNAHGSLSTVLTDGLDLVVYADKDGVGDIFVGEIRPPHGRIVLADDDLELDLTRRGIKSRKGVVVCSSELRPVTDVAVTWRRLAPGHMLVVRQGAVRAEVRPEQAAPTRPLAARATHRVAPTRAEPRRLRVSHRTAYRYEEPVERSTHLLRLTPFHDHTQRVVESRITVSVPGQHREYEDVFGNHVRRVLLETPYKELVITAESVVDTLAVDALARQSLAAPSRLPHPWMPWQRHMLAPYLLSPELPESQLDELAEYARSFVVRNDGDLVDTLLDLTRTLHREYEYRQNATTVYTSPFDVYVRRRGVCQDFTNLFLCLARLLTIPARYVCGYLYTGPKHANQAQSEATHAWVEVYLPEQGWVGLDPTNGVLVQTDHVRVAVGRGYMDATPTSGTLFVGGGAETLAVTVTVEPV